jgi:hypothetical protein
MGVVENMKDVADLVKKFNDIELNRRILNLENEVLDLSRDKRRAEERVEELERALKFSKELVLRDGFYWIEGDDTPFCTACWDAKRLAIRIKRLPLPVHHHRFQCPHCETLYAQRNVGIS